MKTRRTDVIVIGAGTAGLSAYHAIRHAKHRAILVDHGPLGTLCARIGCMPSKAMLHAGQRFSTADALTHWDRATQAAVRARLWREVRAMRDRLAGGTADSTRADVGRDLVMGNARFVAADAIEVDGQRLEAPAFVVATGSHPVVPPGLARFGKSIARGLLTTDTLFSLRTLPTSVGLLGLGNIGIEIGLALARLGVRVIAVEHKLAPAGLDDPVIAQRAIDTLGRAFPMHVGQTATVLRDGAQFRLAIGGETHRVERVLVALGRKPNLDALRLEQVGVAWDDDTEPPIDPDTLRLGRSTIFVAGDASPARPLQHEAVDEGCIAATNALALVHGHAPKRPSRRTPLSIVFSDPDIAQVGMGYTEAMAERAIVGIAGGDHNGRSKIIDAESNLVRVYADRRDGTLLGASLVSCHGEHLAHLLAWAIGRKSTASQLLAMPFYHPTVEEMLQSALKHIAKRVNGS